MFPTSLAELPKRLARIMNAGRVPMIHGSPGVGKSDSVRQVADRNNLFVIDIRLSQMSPTSLNGFGRINPVTNKSEFIPFEDFPLVSDKIPKGYDGWLIFLDEFTSAAQQVQAAAYKIVLDRMVGNIKIHPNCAIIAAGNLDTDGAIVNRMGTAMQSRMVHLQLQPEHLAWIDWANGAGIDYRILAYVNFKPQVLTSFKPDHGDLTFTCGRTLEFASDIIKDSEKLTIDDLALLCGSIGEGNGKEFYGFCDVFDSLPTIDEIIKDPETAKLESKPSFMFGVSSFVANHMTLTNIDKLMVYVKRFSPEFQTIAARQAYKNNNKLISSPTLIKWLDDIGIYL